MPLCYADCGPCGIKPNDRSAELSERFAQYASSTPDVENPQTTDAVGLARVARKLPAHRISNVRDANHIIFVQPPRDASAIPSSQEPPRHSAQAPQDQLYGRLSGSRFPQSNAISFHLYKYEQRKSNRQDRANTPIRWMGPCE